MAIVLSEGALVDIYRSPWVPSLSREIELFRGIVADYATIYRTQPNVQTCVGFIARNFGQMEIHVFERASDTDRVRLAEDDLAVVLEKPNPFTTGYRFRFGLAADLGIFGNSLGAIVKAKPGTKVPFQLVRIPFRMVTPLGDNFIFPDSYLIVGNRGRLELAPDQVVHFRYYNPVEDRVGVPPLEALRQILAEESAMTDYREHLWDNGARIPGFIKRPRSAPRWSQEARDRFSDTWRERWSGDEAGGTPILEDDMDYIQAGFDAQQSQYIESRKLTREECAAAFFIPPRLVGINDRGDRSTLDEAHDQAMQDCIAPIAKMVTDDIDLQLLPHTTGPANRYSEFNLAAKMAGSFLDQAATLMGLTGAPVLAVNEGRAKLNLERIDDPAFDEPVKLLSVLYGGTQAPAPAAGPTGAPVTTPPEPSDVAPSPPPAADGGARSARAPRRAVKAATAELIDTHRSSIEEVLIAFFDRQEQVVRSQSGAKARGRKASIADVFDSDRWNDELKADLLDPMTAAAQAFGQDAADGWDGTYDVQANGTGWISENAWWSAVGANAATKAQIEAALAGEDVLGDIANVFDLARSVRAAQMAAERTTAAGSFGRVEAGKEAGRPGKVWVTTSANPRPSHAEMAGEQVPLHETFSNGGQWPGDPALSADEIAGCTCTVDIA